MAYPPPLLPQGVLESPLWASRAAYSILPDTWRSPGTLPSRIRSPGGPPFGGEPAVTPYLRWALSGEPVFRKTDSLRGTPERACFCNNNRGVCGVFRAHTRCGCVFRLGKEGGNRGSAFPRTRAPRASAFKFSNLSYRAGERAPRAPSRVQTAFFMLVRAF